MFGLSFLTTLNIYNDYFKGRQADAPQCKSFSQAYCKLETYALVHLSLEEVVVFVHYRVL